MPPKKYEPISTKEKQTITLLIVEKNGDIKETEIKKELITTDELAKKCKFKKYEGFCKRTEWGYNIQNFKIFVEMWAKDDGMANQENKYEFPPPLDHDLYFGACVLIAHDTKNNYVDLTESLWDKIYEHLFGGFESLVATQGHDDDDEEDELENIPDSKKTKHGYLKDGFVVDGGVNSDEDDDDDEEDDDNDDEEDDDDDNDDVDDADEDDEDDEDEDDEDEDDEDDDDEDDDDDEGEGEGDDTADDEAKKIKKNSKNKNILKSKHTNTIVNPNFLPAVSSNKDKKIDVGLVLPSLTSKKKNIPSNNKIKNANSHSHSHNHVKNTKVLKNDRETSDGYNLNDSSELSEEDYTYTNKNTDTHN
jgi:hypothetical protein